MLYLVLVTLRLSLELNVEKIILLDSKTCVQECYTVCAGLYMKLSCNYNARVIVSYTVSVNAVNSLWLHLFSLEDKAMAFFQRHKTVFHVS